MNESSGKLHKSRNGTTPFAAFLYVANCGIIRTPLLPEKSSDYLCVVQRIPVEPAEMTRIGRDTEYI